MFFVRNDLRLDVGQMYLVLITLSCSQGTDSGYAIHIDCMELVDCLQVECLAIDSALVFLHSGDDELKRFNFCKRGSNNA